MKKFLTAVVALVVASLPLLSPSAASAGITHTGPGYWMLSGDGHVYAFGGAADIQPSNTSTSAVHLTPTPTGNGYWVLSSWGGIFTAGDATDLGSPPPLFGAEEFTTMAATPSGHGYWLFTNAGRVFRFGDAQFYGDMSGTTLNGPVLDAVATPSGKGYYMVGSDGGVFSFGDAKFHGSTGGTRLNKPVMSLAPAVDGSGYWLVASDGGIFAFDVPFHGSTGSLKLNKPIRGIVASPTGGGYLMVAADGGVFSFGDVPFYGSLGSNPPAWPVVSIAAVGNPPPPPVYQNVTLLNQSGSGNQSSNSFQFAAGLPATLAWHCGHASDYSAGCNFQVNNYQTGEQLDYTSAGTDQSGTLVLHPDVAGFYYVKVDEFSVNDDTTWSLNVTQQQCVANCP